MKTTFYKLSVIMCTFSLLFISCSKGDDNDAFTPTANDIIITLDENPSTGETIGTITTNLTGNLNYTLTSESVTNAFAINSGTGLVTVGDGLKYDYETNASLQATVNVSDGTNTAIANVLVTLNDIDDISHFLTTSKINYNNANNGDWIKITETEYNTLASSLNNISKSGLSDSEYNTSASIYQSGTGSDGFTLANIDHNIPNGSYCFAFKCYSYVDNAVNSKVKISTIGSTSGYNDLGTILPSHDSGDNYFVLKGNDTPTTNTGYLAMYYSEAIGYISSTSGSYVYGNGDTATLDGGSGSSFFLFQALSSTQRQWD